MAKIRTEVENLLVNEMFQEDAHFLLTDDSSMDEIIPNSASGLFDNDDEISSEDSDDYYI